MTHRPTIKTVIHFYKFDTADNEQRAAYKALKDQLNNEAGRPRWMHSHGGDSHHKWHQLDGQTIELETKFIFYNQWNTAPIDGISELGLRVFDWAEDYQPRNKNIKAGHWIEQTPAMQEIRRNTNKCGYCGHEEAAQRGLVFCDKCIDGPHLSESDLHLLRMCPAGESNPDRPELSAAESAHLIPLYRDAQTHGKTERGKARLAGLREKLVQERDSKIKHAHVKHDGFMWFIDQGIQTGNLIYYEHTGVFAWGWRNAIEPSVESRLLDIVSDFPYPYSIQCEDGRKLEGKQ